MVDCQKIDCIFNPQNPENENDGARRCLTATVLTLTAPLSSGEQELFTTAEGVLGTRAAKKPETAVEAAPKAPSGTSKEKITEETIRQRITDAVIRDFERRGIQPTDGDILAAVEARMTAARKKAAKKANGKTQENSTAETPGVNPPATTTLETAAQIMVAHCVRVGGETEPVVQINDIPSNEAPFHILPENLSMPPQITAGLADIYREFQERFALSLPDGHMENLTDYRYCIGEGSPMVAVQIDMAGFTAEEMADLATESADEIREIIRSRIFEIEGSIAGYNILGGLFPSENGQSGWGNSWRSAMDAVREKHRKPIVLLAPTQEKFDSMLGFEFGLTADEIERGMRPTREQIQQSGFDDFWGPDDYLKYLQTAEYNEEDLPENHPLLYVRASNPTEKLKDPNVEVEHPLFSNPETRRIVRAFTLTPNIDDPSSPKSQHINDTKSYMPNLGLAVEITADDEDFANWFAERGTASLPQKLRDFLESRGIDPDGDFSLRLKPTVDTYGGYGQMVIKFKDGHPTGKLDRLARSLNERGSYMAQPEIEALTREDPATGLSYREIFRLFMMTDARTGEIRPMGGFVNSIPTTSPEVKGDVKRVHGNGGATFQRITM